MLTRPAVEAGERLGFLPGDLQSKVDPYLRPLYDALFDMRAYSSAVSSVRLVFWHSSLNLLQVIGLLSHRLALRELAVEISNVKSCCFIVEPGK